MFIYSKINKGVVRMATDKEELELFIELRKVTNLLIELKDKLNETKEQAEERLGIFDDADSLQMAKIDELEEFLSNKDLWSVFSSMQRAVTDGFAPIGTMHLFDSLYRHMQHIENTVKWAATLFEFERLYTVPGFKDVVSNAIGFSLIIMVYVFKIKEFLEDVEASKEDVRITKPITLIGVDPKAFALNLTLILTQNIPVIDIFDEDKELTKRVMEKLKPEEVADLFTIMDDLTLTDLRNLDSGEIDLEGLLMMKGA